MADPFDPLEDEKKYDYLNQILFSGAQPQLPKVPAEGIRRYGQLAMRGATLGFGGTAVPPEGLGESAAEFAGSIPAIAGISALTSPLVAAGGRAMGASGALLRVPMAQRVTAATATGGIVGTATGISENKGPMEVAEEAAKTAASYAALEGLFLGGAALLRKGLKVPPVGRTLTEPNISTPAEEQLQRGLGLAPETPPSANLPVVSRKNFFDPYDFVGSGTVLNPERNPQLRVGRIVPPEGQTRSMLPPGPEGPLALAAPIEEGVLVGPAGRTRTMLPEGPGAQKALPPASERLLKADTDLEALFGIELETGMGAPRRGVSPRQGPLALPPGPAQEEIIALRQGPISRGGAHFALPGESTYFDPENPTAVAYNLTGKLIADTENVGVAKSIVQEALRQPKLNKTQRQRLTELLHDENPLITYRENEELPITQAAKRLGYDGIKIWESDDITKPSTVFLWRTKGLKPLESTYFDTVRDPKTGVDTLIPKNAQIEEAATVAMGINPRMDELPLTSGQIKNLETVQKADKLKMDTITKREGSETSNLLKQSDEVVEETLKAPSTPIAETHSIELTPSGLEARELLIRSGIPEDEFIKFGSTLRGTRDQKMNGLLAWLRERCR